MMMASNSKNPGSGVILLSTEWNQYGNIGDSVISYNEYCPIDPQTTDRCVTGCTNIAASQILYYWLENSDFALTLRLTSDDSYTSVYETRTITIDSTAATAQKNGYLSFAGVNSHLSDFTIGDASDIAALAFACGVVQQAQYSSDATSTAWEEELFYRAGMAGCTFIGCYNSTNNDNPYFYTYSGGKVKITDAGYEILINELLSGRPVATSYPGHALLWDGYDQENDKFHINFGWGGYKNAWYSRAEIYDLQFYQFGIDIMPEYDETPILVTNSAVYGVGTFLRGIEQLQGIPQADTLTVTEQTDGSSIELQKAWNFDKKITINHFNSEVSFKQSSWGITTSANINLNDMSGLLHASRTDQYSATALESEGDVFLTDFSGTISSTSKAYAAGIECCNLSITAMTGTISSQSSSGSVFAVAVSENVDIDKMAGTISASSGTYSVSAIQAGKNIKINTLSGSVTAQGSPGSATALEAGGKIEIANLSGTVSACSQGYSAQGISGTGKIRIKNLSGSISAVSSYSSASGIATDDEIELENISGSITASSQATTTVYAISGRAVNLQNFSGVCIASAGGYYSSYAVHASQGTLALALNDGRIYAGCVTNSGTFAALQQSLSRYGSAGVAEALQYNSEISSGFYAACGSNQNDCIYAKNRSVIQGSIDLDSGNDTVSISGGSYIYAPGISDIETLNIDNTSTIYGTFYGSAASSMTVNMLITGENSSNEMIHLQNYVNNFNYFLKDKTLNIDLRAASDGEYILVSAAGLASANYLSYLSVKISAEEESFTLACGESSSSGSVSLKYENQKLILVLDGYAELSEQALLLENGKLSSIDRSVSNKTLSSDGTDSLRLVNGGSADHITIGAGCDLSVSSDGTANNTLVESYGFLALNQGGCALNTTVNAYGMLNISAGATHKGALTIEEDAVVRAESTGIIDFTLDGFSASSYQGINDFSRIEGTPGYTLTVSQSQSAGTYILAGNAADFDQTITVNGLTESHQLNLSDRSSFETANRKYSLALNSSNELELSIRNKSNPPVITLTGDNLTLRRSAELTASSEAGIDIYYNINNGAWNLYTDAITVNANATYYFKATNDAGDTGYAQKSFNNIVTAPYNLQGDKDGISWSPVPETAYYEIEYSNDVLEHTIVIQTSGTGVDTLALPPGDYQWSVHADGIQQKSTGETITAESSADAKILQSDNDQLGDLFFANASGVWGKRYQAQHQGAGAWNGTGEKISLSGKNILTDFFIGSEDANILMLTDTENGDALFVDDIYTALPGTITEQQARLAEIDEIRAGAGADVIDLTSQRFACTGGGMTLRGGDGDDTIWANLGENKLFGDAGNDRLVGCSGNDVIAGGAGNDSMHGGGGNDIFCFCENWGSDTIEQLSDGAVTLWFTEDNGNWDQAAMTYSDGTNSVTVSGVASVTLKFGDDDSVQYDTLSSLGAFEKSSSFLIFEEKGKGMVAIL